MKKESGTKKAENAKRGKQHREMRSSPFCKPPPFIYKVGIG